jgi:hypothetical protein
MWANHDGLADRTASWLNLTTFSADAGWGTGSSRPVIFRTGGTVAAGVNNNSYTQVNRLFAAISCKNWQLEAGMFYDSLRFDGLSTSNGTSPAAATHAPGQKSGSLLPDSGHCPSPATGSPSAPHTKKDCSTTTAMSGTPGCTINHFISSRGRETDGTCRPGSNIL